MIQFRLSILNEQLRPAGNFVDGEWEYYVIVSLDSMNIRIAFNRLFY
jgi:hypothetical protein